MIVSPSPCHIATQCPPPCSHPMPHDVPILRRDARSERPGNVVNTRPFPRPPGLHARPCRRHATRKVRNKTYGIRVKERLRKSGNQNKFKSWKQKKPREDWYVLAGPSQKRRHPTLPHRIAVPSAHPGLTSRVGMGRGGTPAQ